MPYYIKNPKRDHNLDNHPDIYIYIYLYITLRRLIRLKLKVYSPELRVRDYSLLNYTTLIGDYGVLGSIGRYSALRGRWGELWVYHLIGCKLNFSTFGVLRTLRVHVPTQHILWAQCTYIGSTLRPMYILCEYMDP